MVEPSMGRLPRYGTQTEKAIWKRITKRQKQISFPRKGPPTKLGGIACFFAISFAIHAFTASVQFPPISDLTNCFWELKTLHCCIQIPHLTSLTWVPSVHSIHSRHSILSVRHVQCTARRVSLPPFLPLLFLSRWSFLLSLCCDRVLASEWV